MKRYSAGARFYDLLSGERFVYRAGRVAGIQLLNLRPGDTVFDLGCGTGLNFPLLVDAVGPNGLVIGLDRSPEMLAMSRRRIEVHGYNNVRVIEADATTFDPAAITRLAGRPIDGVIATYALSVIGEWLPTWVRLTRVVRPGGTISIVDMSLPTGAASIFSPLARLMCAFGGADLAAHPWTELESTGTDVRHRTLRGGHIHAVAATVPPVE